MRNFKVFKKVKMAENRRAGHQSLARKKTSFRLQSPAICTKSHCQFTDTKSLCPSFATHPTCSNLNASLMLNFQVTRRSPQEYQQRQASTKETSHLGSLFSTRPCRTSIRIRPSSRPRSNSASRMSSRNLQRSFSSRILGLMLRSNPKNAYLFRTRCFTRWALPRKPR